MPTLAMIRTETARLIAEQRCGPSLRHGWSWFRTKSDRSELTAFIRIWNRRILPSQKKNPPSKAVEMTNGSWTPRGEPGLQEGRSSQAWLFKKWCGERPLPLVTSFVKFLNAKLWGCPADARATRLEESPGKH
jgi:hypothetical protein